ncbi:NADH-quinone oxidoreductase subunit NuoF [Candidatus Synchoanobacter obligatus]|uniref:NADH-quinone oxidoreductase subunit F n=1 Tax=Candidatus Synchoanobacter obligatus TaxID=2919597 RepID=A0ABT1L476_9GAMM|nr:NADH-quinone oxidoreductase subunit NuoF [Candidatus Synchoanobacter obligatus]MCP8351968.1 NADH-quinone oxidoreductase subunit NuoF [Candidatus Synchoanobacter obligatus]
MNKVCLRVNDPGLEAYQAIGGYQVWQRLVSGELSAEVVLEEIKASKLQGRGGAGFMTGIKWGFMNRDAPGDKYLVCNSDEGEPGTCKDTLILRHNPHQLLEGILICAYVIGAKVAYNYLRGEYIREFNQCEHALAEATKAGLVGENILNSGISIQVHHLLGAGSYIVGEETAMMESIEGKRAMPRNKPPFPAQKGLWGKATTINNTETLASVPIIIERGGDWFRGLGVENSAGTKIFCVSGHVNKPGVFELPMGTPFTELLERCGGVRYGRSIKAVIPGGTSMRVIPAKHLEGLTMDHDAMRKVNSSIGSGGVIIMDDSTCMVSALTHMMRFYHDESCGQCTPCREGSGWILQMLQRILKGQASSGLVGQIHDVAKKIEGKTICAFGEAMSWPVTSFIEHFYDEFAHFAEHGQSLVHDPAKGFSWHEHVNRNVE